MNLTRIFCTASIGLTLAMTGCGGSSEEAIQADTAEESADALITFFEKADPEIKKLAKTASDAVEEGKLTLALQSVNQLRAQGAKLTADQFMVVTEAEVNVQNAIREAAESGDKNAQTILNYQSAGRRN